MPSSHKLRLSRSFALTICLNILQHRGRLAGQHGGVERRHRHEEAAEHLDRLPPEEARRIVLGVQKVDGRAERRRLAGRDGGTRAEEQAGDEDEQPGWANWLTEHRKAMLSMAAAAGARLWLAGHYHGNAVGVSKAGIEVVDA